MVRHLIHTPTEKLTGDDSSPNPDRLDENAHWLCDTRKNLNAFVASLHAIRESGESVFHGFSELIGHRDIPYVRLDWPSVSQIDRQKLADLRKAVRRLQVAASEIGPPSANAWNRAVCETWTPALRNKIEELLKQITVTAEGLLKASFSISAVVGLQGEDLRRSDLEKLAAISEALVNYSAVPAGLLTNNAWDQTKTFVQETVFHGRRRDGLLKKLRGRYNDGILAMDLEALTQQWSIAEKAWILPRWIGFRKVRKTLGSVTRKGYAPQNSEIPGDLLLAHVVRQEVVFLDGASDHAKQLLGNYWLSGKSDWDEIESITARADALRKVASQVAGVDIDLAVRLREHWAKLLNEAAGQLASTGQIRQHLRAYLEAFDQFKKLEDTLASLLVLDSAAAWGPDDIGGFVPRVLEQADLWLQSLNGLKTWCHWRAIRRDAMSLNLQPLVEAYEKGSLPAEKLMKMFTRGYYQWWCDTIISAEPALNAFLQAVTVRTESGSFRQVGF
jgi:hypothetical protein